MKSDNEKRGLTKLEEMKHVIQQLQEFVRVRVLNKGYYSPALIFIGRPISHIHSVKLRSGKRTRAICSRALWTTRSVTSCSNTVIDV